MKRHRLSPVRLASGLARRVRRTLRALTHPPASYSFLPAPSIQQQTVTFSFRGHTLKLEAAYTTPLYETVAEVVDFDCYQLRAMADADLQGTTLVDVGANIGVTALCLAQIPDCKVVCFEPDSRNCERLEANLRLNATTNVTVVAKAVAAANGTGWFHAPPHEDVGGRLVDAPLSSPDTFQVATIDLATAVAGVPGRIGLVKIDCEGGEYDIVDQLTPELVTRLERLTFEIHHLDNGRDRNTMRRRLQALGYVVTEKPDPFGRESLHHLLAVRNRA